MSKQGSFINEISCCITLSLSYIITISLVYAITHIAKKAYKPIQRTVNFPNFKGWYSASVRHI
jgi:hypothetical protein